MGLIGLKAKITKIKQAICFRVACTDFVSVKYLALSWPKQTSVAARGCAPSCPGNPTKTRNNANLTRVTKRDYPF